MNNICLQFYRAKTCEEGQERGQGVLFDALVFGERKLRFDYHTKFFSDRSKVVDLVQTSWALEGQE